MGKRTQYNREWHARHPGYRAKQNKRFHELNPEYRARYNREYRAKNTEERKVQLKEAHRKRLEYVRAIKLERGCELCGYNAHHAALDFDHLDPAEKTKEVSTMCWGEASFDVIDAEIAKCRVLCRNCHAIESMEKGHLGLRNRKKRNKQPTSIEIQVTLKFDD
jgi:hypothetical protein